MICNQLNYLYHVLWKCIALGQISELPIERSTTPIVVTLCKRGIFLLQWPSIACKLAIKISQSLCLIDLPVSGIAKYLNSNCLIGNPNKIAKASPSLTHLENVTWLFHEFTHNLVNSLNFFNKALIAPIDLIDTLQKKMISFAMASCGNIFLPLSHTTLVFYPLPPQ